MRTTPIAFAATLLLAAQAASAGSITHSGMLAPSTTNWSANFEIDKFDDLGGVLTLESVDVEIFGQIDVIARAENRDHAARVLTLNVGADISLMMGSDSLAHVAPASTQAFAADAFDGVLDFAGGSGRTFFGILQAATDAHTFTLPMDLSTWIGEGTLTLTGVANALSTVTGGGNLMSHFYSVASIDYTITYTYRGDTPVPTPTAAALGLAGMTGLFGLRRRR